ncbi:Uncharacterized protein BM_BM300 [Brugia malayi]|uniref:Uncharacterized protein n=1 Tax=Brugia malayi TaxID=6279 RepID=A0A4E9EYR3_BRUMA|nr:Uncharacterized protein BM_BM300 [Brugia malayi]VIO89603.1 Uncharacterized protein BM_BM300 [Brugia malayi]
MNGIAIDEQLLVLIVKKLVEKTFTENVAALETGVSQNANPEGLQNFIVYFCISSLCSTSKARRPFEKPRFGLRKAAGFQSAIENDQDDTEKSSFSGAALLKYNFFCEL